MGMNSKFPECCWYQTNAIFGMKNSIGLCFLCWFPSWFTKMFFSFCLALKNFHFHIMRWCTLIKGDSDWLRLHLSTSCCLEVTSLCAHVRFSRFIRCFLSRRTYTSANEDRVAAYMSVEAQRLPHKTLTTWDSDDFCPDNDALPLLIFNLFFRKINIKNTDNYS